MDVVGLPLGFGYIHIYFDAAICYRSCENNVSHKEDLAFLASLVVLFRRVPRHFASSILRLHYYPPLFPLNARPFFVTFSSPPLLHPQPATSHTLLSATMAHPPRPTPAPNRHTLPLHKRQSYVTVSVVANDTDTSSTTPANSSSGSSFPVAIAIPALVGGMAVAIAVFGFWWWWSKRSKRVKRVSLELSSHQINAHAKLTGRLTGEMGGCPEKEK